MEVQSQPDTAFAERMFPYHARLFDRDRIPVVSLAVLGDDSASWRPDGFGYTRWGCALALRFPTVKLLDLDQEVLAATVNPFATLVLLHRDAQETRHNPAERLRRKVSRYRALLRQGYSAADIRQLLRLVEHLLRLDPDLAREARTTMRHIEQEELGMDTFVTSFEEIGREEGLAEGLIQERRTLVLRQLDRKVGPLAPELRERVAALSPERLLDLSDALLDFAGLADLTAWLERPAS